jgi:signal transduction histidine kinase
MAGTPPPDIDAATAGASAQRSVLWPYGGLCLLCWVLYAVAGVDWQRGDVGLLGAAYDASWNLGPPMLLGVAAWPWVNWLRTRSARTSPRAGWHLLGMAAFALAWHSIDWALAGSFFGADHALATLQQNLLWRSAWAVFLYLALVIGFNGVIDARLANAAAMNAARSEAALVRAELAAISGKLNPHFLFNTLNSMAYLVRSDARAAEQALQGFSRMLRYLLDAKRGAADRVPLQDELDFVRDYLSLESLRLGERLKVDWAVDDATLADPVPPLTLQPLVENSIVHAIAPRIEGGTLRLSARRQQEPAGLRLTVSDDGPGCQWPRPTPLPVATNQASGVGLGALQRRFEVDYGGRSRLLVRSAPGQGFHVDIFIPRTEAAA